MDGGAVSDVDGHGIAKAADPATKVLAGIIEIGFITGKKRRVEIEAEAIFKDFTSFFDRLETKIEAIGIFIPGAIDEFHVSELAVNAAVGFPGAGTTVKIDIGPEEEGITIIAVVFPVFMMYV